MARQVEDEPARFSPSQNIHILDVNTRENAYSLANDSEDPMDVNEPSQRGGSPAGRDWLISL